MTSRAICIGVGNYPNLPTLMGAENDAFLLQKMLKQNLGIEESALVRNELAKRQNVLDHLLWARDYTGPGDVLVLTISGHGAKGTAADGSSAEAFLPYDFVPGDPDSAIADHEISEILSSLPAGSRCYCIIDTCHSGGATFGGPASDPNEGWITRRARGADVPPMAFAPGTLPTSGSVRSSQSWLSISACGPNERAIEVRRNNSKVFGLLGICLYEALRARGWQALSSEVFETIRAEVVRIAASLGHTQNPEKSGPQPLWDRNLFS